MFFNSPVQLRDKLKFHEQDGDAYWFCEGMMFELFFTAGKEGPTEKQLRTYLDFQEESIMYVDEVRKKVIDKLEREKGAAPARYQSSPPVVDVVNINTDTDATSMDVVLSFCTFRILFYSRWKTWVAKFRGRELVSVELSQRYGL